jgi:hypothetical protein
MKKILCVFMIAFFAVMVAGCVDDNPSSQQREQHAQEQTQKESIAQSGSPAIKNFREKKLYKDIYELRDQDGLATYTYIVAQQTGKLIFVGESVGFPIPYATQYNNPAQLKRGINEYTAYPQAEPNGLYTPAGAEGTWIMMLDKKTQKARPVYFEERVICSPFPLEQ